MYSRLAFPSRCNKPSDKADSGAYQSNDDDVKECHGEFVSM